MSGRDLRPYFRVVWHGERSGLSGLLCQGPGGPSRHPFWVHGPSTCWPPPSEASTLCCPDSHPTFDGEMRSFSESSLPTTMQTTLEIERGLGSGEARQSPPAPDTALPPPLQPSLCSEKIYPVASLPCSPSGRSHKPEAQDQMGHGAWDLSEASQTSELEEPSRLREG